MNKLMLKLIKALCAIISLLNFDSSFDGYTFNEILMQKRGKYYFTVQMIHQRKNGKVFNKLHVNF